MTHPTDDELEAMAAQLEDARVWRHKWRQMLEAAAMLRALSGTLKAEKRHKLAITGDKINAVSELRQVKAERDALKAELAEAVEVIVECREEIDDDIRHEYPHDHPVQERYRERDFAANPARAFLAHHQKETDT